MHVFGPNKRALLLLTGRGGKTVNEYGKQANGNGKERDQDGRESEMRNEEGKDTNRMPRRLRLLLGAPSSCAMPRSCRLSAPAELVQINTSHESDAFYLNTAMARSGFFSFVNLLCIAHAYERRVEEVARKNAQMYSAPRGVTKAPFRTMSTA